MASTSDEEEMAALYRKYVDIFNKEDAVSLAQLLAYPAMGGGGGTPHTYNSAREFEDMIKGTWANFRTKGWVRSQVDRTEPVLTAGDTGVVRAEFSRYRADGSMYESGSGHYVMRKLDGRWSIIAMVVVQ